MSCGRPRVPAAPIHVVRGASKTLLFTVRADPVTGEMSATIAGLDPSPAVGNLVDLTGALVWFTVKNRIEDDGPVAAKRNVAAGGVDHQVLIPVPQTGASLAQFRVFLDPADTAPLDPGASYWGDAWVQLPGGPPLNRQQVSANREIIIDATVTTHF